MKELNIKLTINELNMILKALGHQSYIEVYDLIDNIQNQAKGQLNGASQGIAHNQENYREPAETVGMRSASNL